MSRLTWISFLAILILSFVASPTYAQGGVEVLQTNLFDAQWPELSADGRYMVFEAREVQDSDVRVFLQEIATGEVINLLEGIDLEAGAYRPDISNDGRFVVFYSNTNKLVEAELPQTPNCVTNAPNCQNIYLIDRDPNQDGEYTEDVVITLASPNLEGNYGNGHSNLPRISGNGSHVLFQSGASDLIIDDTNDDSFDLFAFEVVSKRVAVVEVNSNGDQHALSVRRQNTYSISDDGRFVAFSAAQTGWDMPDDDNQLCYRQGYKVDCYDVFVSDRDADDDGIFDEVGAIETRIVSKSMSGVIGNEESQFPHLSGDGRFVFFWSAADNITVQDVNTSGNVFKVTLATQEVQLISTTDDGSITSGVGAFTGISSMDVSNDGRLVLFQFGSLTSQEVTGIHLFLRDTVRSRSYLVNQNSEGSAGHPNNFAGVSIANNGLAVFSSRATNLGEYENLPTIYGNSIGSYLAPVLELPIQVADGNQAAALHSRYPNGSGRVNSWFDHTLPNYVENGLMTPWTGVGYTNGLDVASCNRVSCYDGHDGIDFSRQNYTEDLDEPILAAATGEVIRIVDGCVVGDTSCGGGLGNQVWIDHGFGYATVYGHLRSISVAEGQEVQAGDQIGVMGNTGRSGGKHLHFGLHYHPHNLWKQTQTVLDPYGWQGSVEDPWITTSLKKSEYVWRNHLETTGVSRDTGPLVSEDGRVSLHSTAALTASLQLMPVYFQISEFLNNLGLPALWLSYPDIQLQAAGSENTFVEYVISDQEAQHFDLPSVVVYRSDSIDSMPITVDSELTEDGVSFAAVEGIYSLHAPLLCAGDIEPDDQFDFARTVQIGDYSGFFDSSSDVDWFSLTLERGKEYAFELSGGAKLQLFDQDGTTALSAQATTLNWISDSEKVYVKVLPTLQHASCELYTLRLTLVDEEVIDRIYLPSVMR